jgi:hypothetical protein
MLKSMILAAIFAIAVIVLMPVGSSTPVLAQTCQQKCEAQYPAASGDRFNKKARAQCINACNKK